MHVAEPAPITGHWASSVHGSPIILLVFPPELDLPPVAEAPPAPPVSPAPPAPPVDVVLPEPLEPQATNATDINASTHLFMKLPFESIWVYARAKVSFRQV